MCVVCVPQPCLYVSPMSSSAEMDPVFTAPNSVIKCTTVLITVMKLAVSMVSVTLVQEGSHATRKQLSYYQWYSMPLCLFLLRLHL